jgi:hypothetical protein
VSATPRLLAQITTAIAMVGCALGPTGGDSFVYSGRWSYEASQETPSLLTLAGPVSLAGAGSAEAFEGTVALTETAPSGAVRVLSGPVSGIVVQDSILDFTAQLGGVSRRHVGVARGDSIRGTWADGPASMASGTFVLRRAAVP